MRPTPPSNRRTPTGTVRVEVDAALLAAARQALDARSDDEAATAALTGLLQRRQLEAVDALSRIPVDLDPQPPQPQT